ncbi:MAG TPA: LysR family transcriptional regulator [Bradyrhizobium sp.]|jgi:LysR family hca operon transcriptional activator|nr:LysR family transcriptional regulator [Bradyrhizobium sp.]
MELRHLRYFVAVAEEGSLTVAAEKRLHTAQPSLSRQIRDLEYEVGVPLLTRSVHGVELTAAGRVFLDHARLALTQAEAATEAARRAAQPSKQVFAMGFTTGQEVEWLPRATSLLRDELANIEIRVSSDHSVTLADALTHGRLDVAFLRTEPMPDIEFKVMAKEPLVAILPSDHKLAQRKTFDPRDLAGETYIGISKVPRVLRGVIADYFERCGVKIVPTYEIDNYAMAISLVASTRGVALLPASARNFLPWSVVSRPLKGETPTIDVVAAYHKANTSPILKRFLARIDELTAATASSGHGRSANNR